MTTKDPLVLEAKFRLSTYEGYDDDWIARVDVSVYDSITLCSPGPHDWFYLPRDCRELWVVVSPYRDEDAYLLIERRGDYYIQGRGEETSFYDNTNTWIARHLKNYPQYNFYISIEVLHDVAPAVLPTLRRTAGAGRG